MFLILLGIVLGFVQPCLAQSTLQSTAVAIPKGEKGIGFDDLNFSRSLHKLIVPAGHTGKIYLIDPGTYAMDSIDGFSSLAQFEKGHRAGVSSADEGDGFIFVVDHGTRQLDAVDVKKGKIVAMAPLANDVDFVRYVPQSKEVWVTEPDAKEKKQLEIFMFTAGDKPALSHKLDISVASDGPESLTIDQGKGQAYTNLGSNVGVIDLKTHAISSQWPNTCQDAHGTAIDEQRGMLFVGCKEGKTVAFDLNQNGKQLGSITTGAGIDLIDYNPALSHLYVSGGKSATVSIIGVSAKGELSLLATGPAATRSHCVAGDDQNNIWVCDPSHGQLLRYKDTLPAVK